jgi:hypothetical protein
MKKREKVLRMARFTTTNRSKKSKSHSTLPRGRLKIIGNNANQLVGSGQKNDIKTQTPNPLSRSGAPSKKNRIRGPVSTSTRQSTAYLTIDGIQSETSYQEQDWPLFSLKELMDNAFDFLNDYYPNECKESRHIGVRIKIEPAKEKGRHVVRIVVRNSNVIDVPVFENVDRIFDFNIWFSTKRNQHRMTCGSLGDFLKRAMGMGYASWTSNDNSEDSFDDRQWEEPIILRFNGKEVKAFLKVDRDTWMTLCDIHEPTLFATTEFTEVEVALPVPDYYNHIEKGNKVLLDKLEKYYRAYKVAKKSRTSFGFAGSIRQSNE